MLASTLELSDTDRSDLQYVSDNNKNHQKICLNDRNILRALQAFYPHLCCEHGSLVDWLKLTTDEFQAYHMISSAYDPNSPVVPYVTRNALVRKQSDDESQDSNPTSATGRQQ